MAISLPHNQIYSYHALIAQTATEPPPPPPGPSPLSVASWGLLIPAVAWAIRQLVEMVKSDKKQDSDLNQTLIDDLRADRSKLLEGNRDGFERVVAAVGSQTIRTTEELADLRSLIAKFTETLHRDVQNTLTSQTDIYAQNHREIKEIRIQLNRIEGKIDCLNTYPDCNKNN